MSLESAIAENTAAVVALTNALFSRSDTHAVTPPAAPKKARKSTFEPTAETTESTIPTLPPDNNQDLYQQAATAITTLSRKKGREAALIVLANFGASKLPEVPLDRLPEVIAATNQALEASE